jgi:hypothetical protein
MSYTRQDDQYLDGALSDLREKLKQALLFHAGQPIGIFQDTEDIHTGQNIQQRIAESLNETMLLLPIITPSYLHSAWCRDEFLRFLDRERRIGRNDLIIPVYYQTVQTLDAAMQHPSQAAPSSDPIIQTIATRLAADWRNLRRSPDARINEEIERIAQRVIQVITEIEASQIAVGLFTFAPEGVWAQHPELIDWSDLFDPVAPSPQVWQDQLMPELKELYQRVRGQNIKRIQLYVNARLSAALAFGYTFREPMGRTIIARDPHGQQWCTGACSENDRPLHAVHAEIDPVGTDLTIEISAVPGQSTEGGVRKWLEDTRPAVRQRIKFTLPGNERITQEDQALAIACQIRAVILQVRQQWTPQTTHLFGAIPAGLAVLIGWHLNTCEPVQCYEYVRGSYQPSCRLE